MNTHLLTVGLLAAVALFAFTRLTREPIIPLARLGLSLTKAGWGAVFFVLFILVSAIQSGANLLFFLASAMIGCIAAALLYGPFALRKVSVTLQMPSWAFAGEEAVAAISVSNAKRFLPIIALRIEGDAEGKAALLAAVASLPARASAQTVGDFLRTEAFYVAVVILVVVMTMVVVVVAVALGSRGRQSEATF